MCRSALVLAEISLFARLPACEYQARLSPAPSCTCRSCPTGFYLPTVDDLSTVSPCITAFDQTQFDYYKDIGIAPGPNGEHIISYHIMDGPGVTAIALCAWSISPLSICRVIYNLFGMHHTVSYQAAASPIASELRVMQRLCLCCRLQLQMGRRLLRGTLHRHDASGEWKLRACPGFPR